MVRKPVRKFSPLVSVFFWVGNVVRCVLVRSISRTIFTAPITLTPSQSAPIIASSFAERFLLVRKRNVKPKVDRMLVSISLGSLARFAELKFAYTFPKVRVISEKKPLFGGPLAKFATPLIGGSPKFFAEILVAL